MMLVAHPLGNACVRALLAGLRERGELARFVTSLGFHEGDRWPTLLPRRIQMQLDRRRYELPGALVERHPWREAVRLAANAAGLSRLTTHERGWASVDAVFHALDHAAAHAVAHCPNIRGVYAYEDGALALFEAAERRGLTRCYELPMGYWRGAQEIFHEEAELQPDWAATLDGLRDSAEKLARKDAELARATHVLVASEFSRRSLERHPAASRASATVVLHGAPPPVSEAALKERLTRSPSGTLRVLFVGGLTQRKGLSYLFAAMQQLGRDASLTVVGRPGGTDCPELARALAAHRHIASLAPADVFAEMRRHDVLVLPSLWEGFGLVLVEALAQGLPIITTPHTAGPDLLRHATAGAVVPIRSADAIAATLHDLQRDPARRTAMALAARDVALALNRARWQVELADFCRAALRSAPRSQSVP